MIERFTEKSIAKMQQWVNSQLSYMGLTFRITRDIINPTGKKREHSLMIANNDNGRTESELAYYRQDTFNTYVTLRAMYALLRRVHGELSSEYKPLVKEGNKE